VNLHNKTFFHFLYIPLYNYFLCVCDFVYIIHRTQTHCFGKIIIIIHDCILIENTYKNESIQTHPCAYENIVFVDHRRILTTALLYILRMLHLPWVSDDDMWYESDSRLVGLQIWSTLRKGLFHKQFSTGNTW